MVRPYTTERLPWAQKSNLLHEGFISWNPLLPRIQRPRDLTSALHRRPAARPLGPPHRTPNRPRDPTPREVRGCVRARVTFAVQRITPTTIQLYNHTVVEDLAPKREPHQPQPRRQYISALLFCGYDFCVGFVTGWWCCQFFFGPPSLVANRLPFSVLDVPARSCLAVSGTLSGRLMAVRGAVSASVLRRGLRLLCAVSPKRGIRRCVQRIPCVLSCWVRIGV